REAHVVAGVRVTVARIPEPYDELVHPRRLAAEESAHFPPNSARHANRAAGRTWPGSLRSRLLLLPVYVALPFGSDAVPRVLNGAHAVHLGAPGEVRPLRVGPRSAHPRGCGAGPRRAPRRAPRLRQRDGPGPDSRARRRVPPR